MPRAVQKRCGNSLSDGSVDSLHPGGVLDVSGGI